VTRGVVKVGCAEAKRCVIFGSELPSWLMVMREMGYRAVMVFLTSDVHLSLVERLVDENCMILSGADWRVFGAALPNFGEGDVTGFVDDTLSMEVMTLVETMKLKQVVGIGGPRRAIPGWHRGAVMMKHQLVGGGDDGEC
jgi:hypothetical protein